MSLKRISSVAVVALVASVSASPCADDIGQAATSLGKATESVLAAVTDCASGKNASECAQDVKLVVAYLSTSAEYINNAVTACGGSGSKCAGSLTELVANLGVASSEIAKAVVHCPSSIIRCGEDVATSAKALLAGAKSIGAATSECGSTLLNTTSRGDDYNCPSSPAFIHASCTQTYTFETSCQVVEKEIKARVAGQFGTWHDPHNNGTYSILSTSTTSDEYIIQLQRVTANKQYTDKMTIELREKDGLCVLDGCSVSQGTSVIDFSTNYCNVRFLFCGSLDGCNTVTTDLESTLVGVNPSLGAGENWHTCTGIGM